MTIIEEKTPEKLSADSIARQVLEAAARMLEKKSGNRLYERAWDIAARELRAMKPD